jgi:hypothetical protein
VCKKNYLSTFFVIDGVLSRERERERKSLDPIQLLEKIQTELVPLEDVILHHHPALIGRRMWSFQNPKPKTQNPNKTTGCVTCGPCHLHQKSIFLRHKEDYYENSNISPLQKYNLQKNPLKETKVFQDIITTL